MPARLRPKRLLLEPVATDRVDLHGPPRAKPGQLRTLVGIYRSAGYQYGIDWRVLAAINVSRPTRPATRTSRAPAPSAGCSSCPRPGAAGASTPPATALRIRTTRKTRSSAPRATWTPRAREKDIRRAIFAYNHANWYVNEVLSIAASIPGSYGD